MPLPPKKKTARQIREAQCSAPYRAAPERPRIEVTVSPTIPEDKLDDPRLEKLLKESIAYFNCSHCFTPKYRTLLCLHEAGHAVYGRAIGSEVEFHGPTIYWDARPQYDMPAISKASTSWTPKGGSVIAIVKSFIGGFRFRELLSDTPNDEIAIGMDMDNCRTWFDAYVGIGDAGFDLAIEVAKDEISMDLRQPEFRKLAWDTAREFERKVFHV
jgi:hypothetical protein